MLKHDLRDFRVPEASRRSKMRPMPLYRVKGRGIDTGRSRSRTYKAKDEQALLEVARRDGTEVDDWEELPPPPATEAQLAYAQRLGLSFPRSISQFEMSDLLTRSEKRDNQATARHLSFAAHYNVPATSYIGKKDLFQRIHWHLNVKGREREFAEWFVFRVHRDLMGGATNASVDHPNHPLIQRVANDLSMQQTFVRSLRRYWEDETFIWFGTWTSPDGGSHNGASRQTASYKMASEQLRQQSAFPARRRDTTRFAAKTSDQSLGKMLSRLFFGK